MTLARIHDQLTNFCGQLIPRLLTQACRDASAAEYGSFDRNWWHYKIRDFSSIILQQGGYALCCALIMPQWRELFPGLSTIAIASAKFWNARAIRFRAFEEYYPWEEGYPPLAFSTLAVVKLVDAGVVNIAVVRDGLEVAARQLLSRFEGQASNQQVAGTAALCILRKVAPELVGASELSQLCERTLRCQHDEGWYMEYGGPDLGYLSVTIDCLWDAYDATGDARLRESAVRALDFIQCFVKLPCRGAGMHNARNTDYIVPYGIARFLECPDRSEAAALVLIRVFENLSEPGHFLHAIDDRYFCHYVGHSLFRALPLLAAAVSRTSPARNNVNLQTRMFKGCGHVLYDDAPAGGSALVSGKKGGVFSVWFSGQHISDFGWCVTDGNTTWVSHWWGDFWKLEVDGARVAVQGRLIPHRANTSTPFKHFVLRVLSILMGRRIIALLKEKLIFKAKSGPVYAYQRVIVFGKNSVRVVDRIEMPQGAEAMRAPRASKRHVASADSFHAEDFSLADTQVTVGEERSWDDGVLTITTEYKLDMVYEADYSNSVLE